jgi:hypothetical protein
MFLCNPFRSNTYKTSCKCSFQKTYAKAKSFSSNTYRKPGGDPHFSLVYPVYPALRGERVQRGAAFFRGYSQRKTFAESAVQTANTTASAATSPTWADHASPFQIPWSSGTA